MKTTKAVVLLADKDGRLLLEDGQYCQGLAITPHRYASGGKWHTQGDIIKDGWSITHCQSGKKVVHHTYPISIAKKILSLLLALPINWNTSEKQIYAQEKKLDPIPKDQFERIRMFNHATSKYEWLIEELKAA